MSDDGTRELFADGIMELGFGNGMVRMDLYSLSAIEKDADGNPKREFRQRIIMPPQGFLESFSTMQEMFKRLESAGVIRRREGAETPPPEQP